MPRGLVIEMDEHGFHKPSRDLDHDYRQELIQELQAKNESTERIYHMLLLIFSNQAVTYAALGELRREVQQMTNAESGAIAALTTAVENGDAIEQLAVTALGSLEQKVADLTAELAAASTPVTVDNSPALAALTAELQGSAQALSDAVNTAAGTTVTTAPPTTVTDPDVPAPVDGTPADPTAPVDPDPAAPVDTDPSTPDPVVPDQDNGGAITTDPTATPAA